MARLPSRLVMVAMLLWSSGVMAQPAQPLATGEAKSEATTTTSPDRAKPGSPSSDLGWGYLFDGGAIPFVYGSAAVAASLYLFASPPDQPRGFPSNEGGAEARKESIPDGYVALFATAATVGLGALPSDARWYHVKGMTEALLTTAALTELSKNFFGRHRPYYDPETSTNEDDRKSFFSGHASLTLAATTYLGAYLHWHVLAGKRSWEPAILAGLAAVSIYVPYTRWDEHMHHTSDLVVGATVGIATAASFYAWQEHRYQQSRAARSIHHGGRLVLLPDLHHRGLILLKTF